MIDFDMLAAQCAPHVAVAALRQQQYYVGVAFDVYISGALWQRVRPGVSVSGEAGVTNVGRATGGSMQPRFEPPPAPSGGSLPFSTLAIFRPMGAQHALSGVRSDPRR